MALDRISNLPDSILSRILSSLPTKDSVSTSILSTRWRNLYASVFKLDLDFYNGWSFTDNYESFVNFIDNMLFFHSEERIEQFRLVNIDTYSVHSSRVCGWVAAALWRGVKELDLDSYSDSCHTLIKLPTHLFCSKTMVRLKLRLPLLRMTVPIHVLLPSLKTLELQDITFEDDDKIKRLISSCPVLEDLSISNCNMQNIMCLKISNPSLKSLTLDLDTDFAIAIDLPSLVYFKYKDLRPRNLSIGNMPSLVTADIDTSIFGNQHGLVELFERMGNARLRSLHLTIYPGLEDLPILSHKLQAVFENLVELKICGSEYDLKGMRLFEFLELSPNLEICILPKEVSFPRAKVPPLCLSYKLKEIKVLDFYDERFLFEMVTYILDNATVLEKLTICTSGSLFRLINLNDEEKVKMTEQLLRIPKSSSKCQFVVY